MQSSGSLKVGVGPEKSLSSVLPAIVFREEITATGISARREHSVSNLTALYGISRTFANTSTSWEARNNLCEALRIIRLVKRLFCRHYAIDLQSQRRDFHKSFSR
jgi:hypothetical protein